MSLALGATVARLRENRKTGANADRAPDTGRAKTVQWRKDNGLTKPTPFLDLADHVH
jgi:hypothetical protein